MMLVEQIQKRLNTLPPKKQSEVLDFITFLQQRAGMSQPAKRLSLKKYIAFGSWKGSKFDAVEYQRNLHSK
jgi:hypothetical protein